MTKQIQVDDIESTLRRIQTEVDSATGAAKPVGLAVGGAVFAGAVGVAYVLGQRKSRKRTTVVEVRRV